MLILQFTKYPTKNVIEVTIMYSTFVVNNATTCYFFNDNENTPIPR